MKLANIIKVDLLKKSFDTTEVLKGVTFNVIKGESVALLGSNGSGKSTLLRCIAKLLEPNSGNVEVLQTSLASARGKALRKLRSQIGFIFQKHNLVPRLSVLSNVIHGSQSYRSGPHTWYQSFALPSERKKAMNRLDMVGLSNLATKRADQLSGGQSQRIAIARALMQDPQIIFADEPVASLDPIAAEEIMQLFVKLVKELNITLLFSTHHLEHALNYSDRIIGLQSGQIQLDSLASEQNIEELRKIYG